MDESVEILRIAVEQSREELSYRRRREAQVFTWTSALLLWPAGSVIFGNSRFISDLVDWQRVTLSALLLVTALVSVIWQHKQRLHAAGHSRVLAEVAARLGYFSHASDRPPLYPESWRLWGTRQTTIPSRLKSPSKPLATLVLAGLGVLLLWIAR